MIRGVLGSLLVLALAAPASAQVKFEASVLGGYTFSEGIKGDPQIVPGKGTFNSIDVASGGFFGLTFGVVMENGGEVGFTYGRQMSKLSLSLNGASETPVGNGDGAMNIDSYHGYFAYNFLPDSKVRPYVAIGFGATDYGALSYTGVNGQGTLNGPVRFSTTWSGGVKAWANDHFGFRASFTYIPTYISSEAEGWWCDPYWGCYLVGDHKYSNQFNVNGGVVFRFGG